MEIKFYRRLLDANKESKLMVMMQIPKVVTQMTVLLKRNLERRNLLLSQRKENKLPGKRKRDIKRKAKTQRISCYHLTIVVKKLTKNCLVQQNIQLQHAISEIDWEVSDFLLSDISCDEWLL